MSNWTANDWALLITTVVGAITALATLFQQFTQNNHASRIDRLEKK